MNGLGLMAYVLQYFIPGFFSMLFRIYGLGAKSRKNAIIGLAMFSALSLIIPSILIPWLGYDVYKSFAFIPMLLSNLAVFIITSDSFIKTCFLHFSQINIIMWISILSSATRRMFDFTYVASDVIRLILSAIAFYIGLRYCARPLRFMANTIHTGWLGLLAIPACISFAAVSVAVYFGMMKSYPELLMIAVITLLELSFIFYMRGLYHSLRESEQLSRERNIQALLQSELIAYEDAIEATKRSRHDLRHHNVVILEYLKNGDINHAIEYLEATDSAILSTSLNQFCKNPTANAVLRIYDRKAHTMGIPFSIKAEIPVELPLEVPEIGALLSNILENAVEACQKKGMHNCFISLTSQMGENGLRLEVRNSVGGIVIFENDLPRSSKVMGGTGTKSIASIVKKYGGMLRFLQVNDVFITQILFPIEY